MNIKEATEKLKSRLEPNKYGGKCALGYSNKYCFGADDLQAIETVLAELEKKENMYRKEYNEHMEKKRQNGVLINNELILKRELEKKSKIINLMAEQLTTDIHSKEWVIDYYEREVEK